MTDVFSDAERRYHAACERRAAVEEIWINDGRPLLTSGSTGQLVEHPLVKQLNDLDRLCDRLGDSLKRKHSGPDPTAVVRASIGKSPASRLRAVK